MIMRSPLYPRRLVAVLAIILGIALVVRAPFIAVAPIVTELGGIFNLDATQLGLLTGLPVICFAILTPLASTLIGRVGANFATTLMILGCTLGIIIRSIGDVGSLYLGNLILGSAIAVGNLLIPVLIRRDMPPGKTAVGTAFYSSMANCGSMLCTAMTVPLSDAFGWQVSLGVWGVVSAVALIAWVILASPAATLRPVIMQPDVETGTMPIVTEPAAAAALAEAEGGRRRKRAKPVYSRDIRRLTLLLTLAFTGQSITYYGVSAWLPTIIADLGAVDRVTAGNGASVFQFTGIVGAIVVPLLIRRLSRTQLGIMMITFWSTIPLGFLFAPDLWLVWSFCAGVAQGGAFTLIFSMLIEMARGDDHARRASMVLHWVAYIFSSMAAPACGMLLDLTGGWTAALLLILGSTAFFGANVLMAARLSSRMRAEREAAEAARRARKRASDSTSGASA